MRDEKVEIDIILNIDEQRVIELAERIKELNKKIEPHAIEFARLWGEEEQRKQRVERLHSYDGFFGGEGLGEEKSSCVVC